MEVRLPVERVLKRIMLLALVSIGLIAAGCGRWAKPLPPQEYAPAAVKSLEVTGQLEGVKLKWKAPKTDARDKDLLEIEGYRVYRRSLTTIGDVARLTGDEILVTTIDDTHLKEIKQMHDELLLQGRPSRRADLPKDRYEFEYLDSQVVPSARYAYRVVPINQDGTEGVFDNVAQVLFRGDRSEVILLPIKK